MFEISEKEYIQFTSLIKKNYGIHLGREKQTLLVGRLHNILAQNNLSNFTDYFHYIVQDTSGNAVSNLVDKITTNHTFFMREPDHFNFFKEKVLPFFTNSLSIKDLRVWSAGCSSGEEPYTLAMIIDEFLGTKKDLWNTKILATDLSSKVLESANNATYTSDQISPIPLTWKQNYFIKNTDEKHVLIDRIRNEIVFRRFNFMDSIFPFKKKFHVIFCRNVMIYFDNETKRELVEKFYNLTEPGGYLFIGHSETINRDDSNYTYIAPSIYRKKY